MISPAQAEELLGACQLSVESETVSIEASLHRVLSEDLLADTDLPPFNRVMMDGIALQFRALEEGIRSFPIQDMQRAGQLPLTLENKNNCIEIMTGAVCSFNCDTVVPYEHIRIENGKAHVNQLPGKQGKNIHVQGNDKKMGTLLTAAGTLIGPAEMGIAASVGKNMLRVKRLPRVLICSTGDELVDVTETPLPHQIRRSNSFALSGLLKSIGIQSDSLHLPDDAQALIIALTEALKSYDVLLLSGGVSKGKFDLLPEVLEQLGVNMIFHGIAQRPGKPMWFGRAQNSVVFALPGNPVSTLACAARYMLPWIKQQMAIPSNVNWVRLEELPSTHEKLSLFLPVVVSRSENQLFGQLLHNQGSGDFSALSGMHGFIEVPPQPSPAKLYRFYPMA